MKVLIIESGGLGDFISTMPAIRFLREEFRNDEITIMIPEWYADVARQMDYVDHVRTQSSSLWKTLLAVRGKKYDWVINFHPARKNSLLTLFSRARARAGYFVTAPSEHYSYRDNSFFLWKGTQFIKGKTPAGISLYDRALKITKLLTRRDDLMIRVPFIFPTQNPGDRVKAKKYIVLHPFSSKKTKNWPMEIIDEFVTRAWNEFHVAILIIGDRSDQLTIQSLVTQKKNEMEIDFQIVPMSQLPLLLSESMFFVGVDSGPLHMAVGLDAPSVGLFGRTAPPLAFPENIFGAKAVFFYKNHPCPCPYNACIESGKCMRLIRPEEVIRAARQLLN